MMRITQTNRFDNEGDGDGDGDAGTLLVRCDNRSFILEKEVAII